MDRALKVLAIYIDISRLPYSLCKSSPLPKKYPPLSVSTLSFRVRILLQLEQPTLFLRKEREAKRHEQKRVLLRSCFFHGTTPSSNPSFKFKFNEIYIYREGRVGRSGTFAYTLRHLRPKTPSGRIFTARNSLTSPRA